MDLTSYIDSIVFDTGLAALSTNGAAGDTATDKLYYRSPESGSFYFWSRPTNSQVLMIGQPLPGFSSNAAMLNGDYWYVESNTDALVRATIPVINATNSVVANVFTFDNFDGTGLTAFSFGDISISKSGILYGSSNYGLFSVAVWAADGGQRQGNLARLLRPDKTSRLPNSLVNVSVQDHVALRVALDIVWMSIMFRSTTITVILLMQAAPIPIDQLIAQYQAGNIQRAKQGALAAVKQSPTALLYGLLGTIELDQAQPAKAEEYLRKAVRLNAGLIGARLTLAQACLAQDKRECARTAYREVLQRDRNNRDALLSLGSLEADSGQLKRAAPLLERALRIDDANIPAILKLARVRNLEGNSEGSLALLMRARELTPDNPNVVFSFGVLCLQMDLIKDAMAALEEAVRLAPSDGRASYALASARIANRDFQGARQIYETLLRADRTNAQLHYAFAASCYLAGETGIAEREFQNSLDLEPNQVESLYYLGLIAQDQGELQRSVGFFQKVLERAPDHARAHMALGVVYRSTEQISEARRELETAVRLAPQSQKAHYQLGLLLAKAGESEKAKEQFGKAKELREEQDARVSWELAKPDGVPHAEHR